MSLMSFAPSATQAPKAIQPVVPTQINPTVVNNQLRPVSSLRGYVEGMRCVVHYYSQVNDGTQATYGHDVGKSPLLQQFIKIKRLEIILDGDINPSQNNADKTFTVTGSAFITMGVIPNEGDMFSMDVGDGRVGVMQINNSQRLTAMNNAVYQVDFQLMYYASELIKYNDLEAKVVQQLNYVRDFAQFGKDPVVTDDMFADLKALSKLQFELANDYLRAFTNKEHKLLTLPGQLVITHDPFCASAFRSTIDIHLHHEVESLRFLNVSLDNQTDQPTLWDALKERRPELLIGCRDRSNVLNAYSLRQQPVLRSLRYSGAELIVFPFSRSQSNNKPLIGTVDWVPTPLISPGGAVTLMNRVGTASPVSSVLVPLHPVCKDGFYVLSEAFYTNTPAGQSLLEKLVWDYLQGEGISSRDLHYLISNHRSWPADQRYFYTPILLILIRSALIDAV